MTQGCLSLILNRLGVAVVQGMLRRAAFFWLSAVLLAGCVRANLTPALQPAAPLPGAGHVLVYEHAATPDEIELHLKSKRNDLGQREGLAFFQLWKRL